MEEKEEKLEAEMKRTSCIGRAAMLCHTHTHAQETHTYTHSALQ